MSTIIHIGERGNRVDIGRRMNTKDTGAKDVTCFPIASDAASTCI